MGTDDYRSVEQEVERSTLVRWARTGSSSTGGVEVAEYGPPWVGSRFISGHRVRLDGL